MLRLVLWAWPSGSSSPSVKMSTGGGSTAVSVVQEPPSSGSSSSHAPGAASEMKDSAVKQGGGAPGGEAVPPPPPVAHNLQTHYDELLRVIAEVGKDVKPAYTNSKMSADRLKRNIALARTALRDCLLDIERLSQSHTQK